MESTCSCRGMGSVPGPGRFYMPWDNNACTPQVLNPYAATTEALHALEPMLCDRRSHCNKKPVHHNWGVAPAHCSGRKPTPSSKDPLQPKIIK